jgi:hypothetical protein
MTPHRPAPLGVLAAALLGAPAIIWAQEAGAPPSLFTGLAPWLTVALGVIVAAVLLRRRRSPGDASSDRAAALREGEARLEAIMRSAMDASSRSTPTSASSCNIAAEDVRPYAG